MSKSRSDLTVLVVDDSLVIRELLTDILRQHGVGRVIRAADGVEALSKFDGSEHPIDLVFCDLAMPGIDGVETLRHLALRGADAAVVVLSALDRRLMFTVADMAEQSGLHVLGTLPKPVDVDAVLSLVDEVAAGSAGREASAPWRELSIEEFDSAMEARRIEVHYQPKIRLEDGVMIGVEALTRLRHPQHGLIGPDAFIPMIERHGRQRISHLTVRVMRHAIAEAGLWRKLGHRLGVAINLSVLALNHLDLPETVADYADAAKVPRSEITFELTEGKAVNNREILDVLSRLRLLGFALSIDDYGTGDSGLQRLKRLPFTELKVDRSFVDGASSDRDLTTILSSSIELGRSLGMKVVAEGVEKADDWRLLERLGCDQVQGFLASRPLPAAHVPAFSRRWNATPAPRGSA